MAIRKLREVPREMLVGKYICTPSHYTDQEFGWPALVEKTTAARLTCVRLPRGAWDPVEKEWQVMPTRLPVVARADTRTDELDGAGIAEQREQYNLSSVKYVCDTAAEAIALYAQALATRKSIETFRKTQLARLNEMALAGELPTPRYLDGEQPEFQQTK